MTWYDDAMRTIIELPTQQLEALEGLCLRDGISRAEAIRRAIAQHVRLEIAAAPRAAFGLWKSRKVDGLTYQRRMRGEWDREPAPRASTAARTTGARKTTR